MRKKNRIGYILISVLALVNVISVPFYEVWGGLVPRNPKNDFVSVMKLFLEDPASIELWAVKFTICVFVPSLIMFIFALFGNRILFVTADILGIIFWSAALYDYTANHFNDNNLFNINNTSISIGYWVAIIIYILALIVGFAPNGYKTAAGQVIGSHNYSSIPENSDDKTSYDSGDYGDSNFYGSSANVNTKERVDNESVLAQEDNDEFKFCPYCGTKLNGKVRFCGKCGKKI